MERDIARVARAGKRGIILDTNLLVIYLVGLYRKECVKDFVTGKTRAEDFDIIKRFIQRYKFKTCIVTPHILAEVSNITFDAFMNTGRSEYVKRAINFLKTALERSAEKDSMIDEAYLPKLGFADASIIEVAKSKEYLVMTEDFDLAERLRSKGSLVININHIRQIVMQRQ